LLDFACKRDPQLVRALVGLTNDNFNLKNADKLMKRPDIIDLVSETDIDAYLENVDAFTRTISEVDNLTYAARTDHDSTETFTKGTNQPPVNGKKDYLAQAQDATIKLQAYLSTIVDELHLKD
jgi:hypothetical protein